MSGELIELKFKSPHIEPDMMAFHACRTCRNKTFTMTEDRVSSFPLMRCAACGNHIGRMGWVHDDDPALADQEPKPADVVPIRPQAKPETQPASEWIDYEALSNRLEDQISMLQSVLYDALGDREIDVLNCPPHKLLWTVHGDGRATVKRKPPEPSGDDDGA